MSSHTKMSSSHSHIKSLGLDNLQPIDTATSLVGQYTARKAAALIVHLVRMNKMSGRGVLIHGPSASGKTALAIAISQEINGNFVHVSACEINSGNLMVHVRRALRLRLKEVKKVYEGEITSIKLHGHCFELEMRTAKGSGTVRLAASMYDAVMDEELCIGDVVYIEPFCGIVKKIGRAENAYEYDIEMGRRVPLPKKEVERRRVVQQTMSFYDMDQADETAGSLRSAVRHILGQKDLRERTLADTNAIVDAYVRRGMGEVQPGILFIDECHLLNRDAIFQVQRVLEDSLSPLILMATSDRQFITDKANEDLMDRLFFIETKVEEEAFNQIIEMRAKELGVGLSKEGVDKLAEIARKKGLRHALNILLLYDGIEDDADVLSYLDGLFD